MKKHVYVPVAFALAISLAGVGCAGSKSYSSMWQREGNLRVVEPDSASHDYKFYLQALRDIGVNTQNKEDRVMMYRGYLEGACRDVEIVEEQFLPSGGSAIGDLRHGTYISKVKCLK